MLGAGATKEGLSPSRLLLILVHLFPMSRSSSLIYEHAECIRNLDIYYGMMPRSNTRGET